ncbi:MAG TPA: radical SAM protein [Bryobacteraceae bacterium]|nr:radical SAM protein [Bryobacteraceae bacterium]
MIDKLPILVLNPHNRCNCRCVMCDIWKRDTVQEISPAQLEAQLESIESLGVEWVVFTGGEALMHSDLHALCSPLRDRHIRLTLLSSGLLLERHAARIAEDFSDLIVSLDGPPAVHDRIRRIDRAFDHLRAGIERIRATCPEFPIAGRCTVQRENADSLLDTWRTARRLHLNSISYLAADLTSDAFNRQPGAAPDLNPDPALLSDEIERLIASGECGGFIAETPAKLRRIANHFRGEFESPVCNAPWISAVIEAEGAVRPCFFQPPIGRLTSGVTLRDVLNGPQAIAFRDRLDIATNSICRRCVCSLNMRRAA